MGGWFYIGINILSVLSEREETEAFCSKWLITCIVYMHDASGDFWDDEISATGIPSSGVVLGGMERRQGAFLGCLEF